MDGYFVHFVAPENLPPMPKHVIFVLDTSGRCTTISMMMFVVMIIVIMIINMTTSTVTG